jgi:two-component system NtrC family sensor kinase
MKFFLILIILIESIATTVYGQQLNLDSLINSIENSPNDTIGFNHLLDYSNEISFSDPARALKIDLSAVELARKIQNPTLEAYALNSAAEDDHFLGNYADALKMQFQALQIHRQIGNFSGQGETLGFIGVLYNELAEYRQALAYLIPGDSVFQKVPGNYMGSFTLANIGDAYDSLHMADSALYYIRESYLKLSETNGPHLRSYILEHMGSIYAHFGKYDSALYFFNGAVSNSRSLNDKINLALSLKFIADVYNKRGMTDSAKYYAYQAFTTAQSVPSKLHILKSADLLASLYGKTHQQDSVLFYLQTVLTMKDSLYGPDKYHKLQVLLLDEQQHQNAIHQQDQEFRNRIKYILLIAALAIIGLIAFIQLRANRVKQKANILLEQQKGKIEETLAELRSTQAQLIQSEKMASLGELTAGIAHEIQNPLNFVNNFSEVNTELISELEQEAENGNLTEVKTIAKDIRENEEKINHHGKRADAIVKGMLQHSRSGSGTKESVDINALADEYLRLSYHGIRAKDKLFNATIQTNFDLSIGNISIMPQDVGRVLLNLYNNAFYALKEKGQLAGADFKPAISVSTIKEDNRVLISVRDNGGGIPKNLTDKIFQPFFTTKPAGQGTGLGLSLSYDIVKAHGGEIKLETVEGEFTEFIIKVPI